MAHSMMHSIGSAVSRFFERRREARARAELLTLDDHALADIGMVRSELEAREDPVMAHDIRGPRSPRERAH